MERALADAVIAAGRKLYERGFNHATSGNVSVRAGERVVIKPAGVPYERMRAEDVSVLALGGAPVSGLKPSSEFRLHLAIYAARSDVGAVVHAHPPHASAFAAARQPIPAVLDEALAFLGSEVPVTKYAPSGDPGVGAAAVAALGASGVAAVMANHGAVTVGRSLDEAMGAMELVEHLARIVLLAEGLGGARPLPPEGVAAMLRIFERAERRY